MLYQITDGTVSAGGQVILSHIDFEIKGKEKIAIVGRNGAGKTTLLRLIAGEVDLDRDDKRMGTGIRSSRKVSVGMLHQNKSIEQDRTVEEIILESCPVQDQFAQERFLYETEYDRLLTGFGFDKKCKTRKLSEFSGGEQTKISLIRLLLMKPDILLLDEPTNHLDIATVEWLEQYMKEYDKAVVLVSHDRFFLDRIVDVVYELQNGKLQRYVGNYTNYREEKVKTLRIRKKNYERQQEELKRLNDLVEKFKNKPRKAAFARSRKTLIERMERMEKPMDEDVHIFTGPIEPVVPGSKWVVEMEHLKVGYEKTLLEITMRIRRGQKIAIIGDNGVGKTALLKTIAGLIQPLNGKCILGNQTLMGYFDQQTASIQSEKSVAEHFHDLFPGMTQKEVRKTLGEYLFPGKDAAKKVSALSGGEKSRLVLAEILTGRPNLLLLDEPTNHMDIQAKETLESAFGKYTGTILFISHDRYFIRQVADAILLLDGQSAFYYPFGYEHYLDRVRRGSGENLAAMIQAEEQAMIADLRAVPKGERHETRPLSTQEAYMDWRLRLAAQPVKAAEEKVEVLSEQWKDLERERQELELFLWYVEKYKNQGVTFEETERDFRNKQEAYETILKLHASLGEQLESAWNQWTDECMAWMDDLAMELE